MADEVRAVRTRNRLRPIWTSGASLAEGSPIIISRKALAVELNASVDAVAVQLTYPVDPLPARYMPGGIIVFRSRLKLWLERWPHPGHHPTVRSGGHRVFRSRPHPDIPHLYTWPDIRAHLHLTTRSTWEHRTYSGLPVYGGNGENQREVWAYVEALNDWLDMMSMSLRVRSEMLAARRALGVSAVGHSWTAAPVKAVGVDVDVDDTCDY